MASELDDRPVYVGVIGHCAEDPHGHLRAQHEVIRVGKQRQGQRCADCKVAPVATGIFETRCGECRDAFAARVAGDNATWLARAVEANVTAEYHERWIANRD